MVLFDCRNVYETEIGRFEVPQEEGKGGVPVIDPHTRKVNGIIRDSMQVCALFVDV